MMELPLDSIVIGDRARQDMGDINELADSIRDVGLLHPPVVRLEGDQYILVAGARRIKALDKLDYDRIPVTVAVSVIDEMSALEAERDENTCRKPFTISEAVALAESIEARIAAEAKQRQRESGGANPGLEKLPQPVEDRRTATKIAKAVGTSRHTLTKARKVVEASKDQSLPEPVREAAKAAVIDMDRTGKVDGAYRNVVTAAVTAASESIVTEYIEGGADVQMARWLLNFARAQEHILAVTRFDDQEVAERAPAEELDDIAQSHRLLGKWLDRINQLRSPLRVVQGGKS